MGYFGFGAVFLCVGMLWAMYVNTRSASSDDGMSAYSLFNSDVRKMDGDIDMNDVDQQLRRGRI